MTAIEGEREVKRRGSSRAARFTLPRLARWAGVGVFVFAMALSCGDDEYEGGPSGDPNPNDPHPVWVFEIHKWAKYDQNGRKLLEKDDVDLGRALGLNPAKGEIWAAGSGGIEIYNSSASLKKNTELEGYVECMAFDTKDKKAWVLHEPEFNHFWLTKLTCDGDIIFDKPLGSAFVNTTDIAVYEETGIVWVTTRGGSRGGYIHKMDKRGDVVFTKTGQELGYDYEFVRVRIDQTDGGVWIDGGGSTLAPFLLKINQDGKPVQKLYRGGANLLVNLVDVGRTTGDVLIGTSEGPKKPSYTRLYDKSGKLLWQSEPAKPYGPRGICDYDGSCWVIYRRDPGVYKMSKISRTGEYLIRDIPTFGNQDFFKLFIKNDPYPY